MQRNQNPASRPNPDHPKQIIDSSLAPRHTFGKTFNQTDYKISCDNQVKTLSGVSIF